MSKEAEVVKRVMIFILRRNMHYWYCSSHKFCMKSRQTKIYYFDLIIIRKNVIFDNLNFENGFLNLK